MGEEYLGFQVARVDEFSSLAAIALDSIDETSAGKVGESVGSGRRID